jgi:AdoMet-dependent heme synthase
VITTMTDKQNLITPKLQVVAWEITRSCNLACAHCRASSGEGRYDNELTMDESRRLIDEIREVGNPIIILTGGEPLLHPDILSIASYARDQGLRVVLGSNGTLLSEEMATSLKKVSVARVGVSLDFPNAVLQDDFRGKDGAFDAAIEGIRNARRSGMEIQINSTVTKLNVGYLEELLDLALKVGAVAFHPFMLVPTGRGKNLESVALSAEEYETTLNWIYDKQLELGDRIFFKPTDAPHYMRIARQRQRACPAPHASHMITRGCLAGTGFCFISSRGRVQGCGYLDVEAGNIREESFSRIWQESTLFQNLRNLANLKGKCGVCEYQRICGGCRARAYEATGDYLAEEPYCVYEPAAVLRNPNR